MKVLVTGSSGYIGSVLCKVLKENGYFVYGIDESNATDIQRKYMDDFTLSKVGDDLSAHFDFQNIDAICHLAASADVTDSMTRPSLYYHNNIGQTSSMMDQFYLGGWDGKLIFSSTAAVYGDNNYAVDEDSSLKPINAYGHSKLMCEYYLHAINKIHKTPITIFRYFNVAGGYGDVGDHLDSGHILQKLCNSYFNNTPFNVFGTDYNTRDGTCVRDYIHVLDVCGAHLKALEDVDNTVKVYNLGTGSGITVNEMLHAFVKFTTSKFTCECKNRRDGDPAFLVANSSKFINDGFEYKHSSIDNIIQSTIDWYRSRHAV